MRYGIGPNEIISITPKPETIKRWACSAETCSRIVQDIANMFDHNGDREVTSRPVTSLGHQGEEFSERGPNFLNFIQ